MRKSDPVCVVSPPEGSPGADGVLADFIRSRKPLLLLATDPTHPIGGERRQPRPQLRGGAADSRPDPAADHTPGWDSLSLCVCVMVFLLCESEFASWQSTVCVRPPASDSSAAASDSETITLNTGALQTFEILPVRTTHCFMLFLCFTASSHHVDSEDVLTEYLKHWLKFVLFWICFVRIVISGYSVWNEFSVISCKCFALIAAGLFPLHRLFKIEINIHLRRFVLTWKVTTQVRVVLKSTRFVCISNVYC